MNDPEQGEAAVPAAKGVGEAVLARSPQMPSRVSTRHQLQRTKLGRQQGVLRTDAWVEPAAVSPSIVSRRHAYLRKRRKKRILIAVAVLLAVFPPMWAVYLIAWLVWRARPRQRSMRNVRSAIRALERNHTGVALKKLQEAHFLDPSNSDALYWLGMLLSQQGRFDEAAEALSLVAERVPGLPEVETALVDAYIASGEGESAVYHAQRLLGTAPYAPESQLKLAEALAAVGRFDMAIDALERAPIHKQVLDDVLVEIHYRLGELHARTGDADRALQHFKRVYLHDITYKDVRARVDALEAPRPD